MVSIEELRESHPAHLMVDECRKTKYIGLYYISRVEDDDPVPLIQMMVGIRLALKMSGIKSTIIPITNNGNEHDAEGVWNITIESELNDKENFDAVAEVARRTGWVALVAPFGFNPDTHDKGLLLIGSLYTLAQELQEISDLSLSPCVITWPGDDTEEGIWVGTLTDTGDAQE